MKGKSGYLCKEFPVWPVVHVEMTISVLLSSVFGAQSFGFPPRGLQCVSVHVLTAVGFFLILDYT